MPTKRPQLYLSGDTEADRLLSEDPLALLIGLVLDQQIPLEWAFYGPFNLQQRLGGPLDAGKIAAMSEDELITAFVARPALHRFPAAMARRVQALCQHIVSSYGGDAAKVWKTAKTGNELLDHVRSLPGFGEQKAKIFVALLGKQLGVKATGWVEVAKPFGESGTHLSIADIDSPESLTLVRQHKREMKLAAKAATPATKKAPARAGAAKKAPARAGATKKAPARAVATKKAPARAVATKKAPARAGATTAAKRASTGA
jgi:uncharacterized HhH-GPD family protein